MPAEACIALTDDAAMQRLNKQFRDKDKPTNVLSFPSALPSRITPRPLGDIALGYETVRKPITATYAAVALGFAVVAALGAVFMAARWPR